MQASMCAIAWLLATLADASSTAQLRVTVSAPSASTGAPTLELAAPLNAIASGRLVVLNAGVDGHVRHWEAIVSATACAAPQPVRWLDVAPTFGALAGGESVGVAVYASSFAATTVLRQGFVCIRAEGANAPPLEVPVALTVAGAKTAVP